VSKSCPNSIVEKEEKKKFSDSSSEYSTKSADNELYDGEKMKLSGPTKVFPGETRQQNKTQYNASHNGSDTINWILLFAKRLTMNLAQRLMSISRRSTSTEIKHTAIWISLQLMKRLTVIVASTRRRSIQASIDST